jgi:hypothetical protein
MRTLLTSTELSTAPCIRDAVDETQRQLTSTAGVRMHTAVSHLLNFFQRMHSIFFGSANPGNEYS